MPLASSFLAAGRAAALVAGATLAVGACAAPVPVTMPPVAATPITAADLRARVYAFAHDSMMGREAPGPFNDKATDYIAAEVGRLGLEPAGENGTWFQHVLESHTVDSAASVISVGPRRFAPGVDFVARWQGPGARELDGARVVFGGAYGSAATMIDSSQSHGRVVVLVAPRLASGEAGWQVNRGAMTLRYRNAAAVVVATLDALPPDVRRQLAAPAASLRGEDAAATAVPQYIYASKEMARALLGADPAGLRPGATGPAVRGRLTFEAAPGQARNVVAILRGSDPALRESYVAMGAHSDHVGFTSNPVDHDSLRAFNAVVRPEGADQGGTGATDAEWPRIRAILDSLRRLRPPRPDSIFNGADDDASGSMALLEIAEAMAGGERPKRSVLFVWHTAEEAGLLGAEYFSEHPTVPRDSIVAMINLDMIGRGTAADVPGGRPGYLQLIGSRRLSTELGDLVEQVNQRRPAGDRMTFDYRYDAAGHPAQYYCRSDHYHYARFGIPVVFLSSGGHRDYHMVTDEAQYLDYDALRMVTQFVHDVVTTLTNRERRVALDKPRPDPAGPCVQ